MVSFTRVELGNIKADGPQVALEVANLSKVNSETNMKKVRYYKIHKSQKMKNKNKTNDNKRRWNNYEGGLWWWQMRNSYCHFLTSLSQCSSQSLPKGYEVKERHKRGIEKSIPKMKWPYSISVNYSQYNTDKAHKHSPCNSKYNSHSRHCKKNHNQKGNWKSNQLHRFTSFRDHPTS